MPIAPWIGHVVAGQGNGRKAGTFQRRKVGRVSAGRRHIARVFGAAVGMRHLQMAHGDPVGATRGAMPLNQKSGSGSSKIRSPLKIRSTRLHESDPRVLIEIRIILLVVNCRLCEISLQYHLLLNS